MSFRKRQETTIALLKSADQLRRHLAAVIDPHGITLQQYNVLRILRGVHPQALQTLEIGDRLIEEVPGITRLLDRLEDKGLVRRERSTEDRRRVHCWITARGLKVLEKTDEPMDKADVSPLKDLSENEVDRLHALLVRILAQLQS